MKPSVNKADVTDEAISSVAQSLLHTDEVFQFEYEGNRYELAVKKLKEVANEQQ